MRLNKKTILIIVLLAIAGAGVGWYVYNADKQQIYYRTAEVKRGDLAATIGATGTVEPEEVVDVGAQVAGIINSFGKDKNGKEIDYGSVVEEGTVLAQIDDSLYSSAVAQARAQLEQNKASVERDVADLEQKKALLYQAQRDWDRAQKLGPSEALAQSAYDGYQAAYETAKANVLVDEATISQAKASVSQAEAALQYAERNLNYCTIKSPVKGVIIDRRVNIGQTVVSSLSAPSLFLIAKDLKRMEIWVSVNEADIGNIHEGQPVSFTVDAYPNETFHGEVGKVRLNATMTQNVVTYTVEVVTDNSSGKLLPYLTANASFELNHKENVLMVPNVALRWSPQADLIAPEFRGASLDPKSGNEHHKSGKGEDGKDSSSSHSTHSGSESASHGIVWVQQDNYVRPIQVRVGLSDGLMTEVQGDGIEEGLAVVTGEQKQAPVNTGATNPFTPQLGRRGR